MLHRQRGCSAGRDGGHGTPRQSDKQQHKLSFKMSQLGFTVLLSLVLLPCAEATSLNRSRVAVLSAQLAPTTPKQAFHRNIQFEGEAESQDPFVPAIAEDASADLLSPPASSFYSLASKIFAPARYVANSARRMGRYLLTGERQVPQQQQQQQQQQQKQPQPLRASMRLSTPPPPRVGPQFGKLLAQGLQPGLSPSTKGKLSEIAQRYKPSNETAAAIAAASRAQAAAAPRAAHQPPAPAAAAAEGKGVLAGAREFGVKAFGGPRQGFTAEDFQLKDIEPRLKRAETELSRRKEEEAKRQKEEEHKRKEEEMRRESEREKERRRKEEEERKREEEERRMKQEEENRKKQEEAKQREKERQRQEEEERERKAREEAERREAERKKEAEERERQEQEKKRKEEAERQRKREEEEARGKKEAEDRKKREAERREKEAEEKKKKEEEERRKKDEEEQRRKTEAERQKKEKEIKKKEEEDKKNAKETLTSRLKQRTMVPVSRQPFGKGKSVEELKILADQMFAEVDEEARRSSQFTQAPLPELILNDFISDEEKKAAANPTIDPTIPKEQMERAINIIKDVAKKYSTEINYFPSGTIQLQSAVNDNPKFGCHTMTTKWSACSTTCGSGSRMRLHRSVQNNGCMTTAEREACISSTGCKGGLQFLTGIEGPIKGLPADAQEELGRLMTKNAKVVKRPDDKGACVVYDTGFTARAYTKDGLLGPVGHGYHYRIYQELSDTNSCKGEIQNRITIRNEKLTMEQFRQKMLERHNAIRRQHSIPDLKWNPLIAANMLHYLKHQDQYHECRMEHSPREHRQLPGFTQTFGENLFTSCFVGRFPTGVADDWASEAHCYRYGNIGNPCTGLLGPKCSIEDHAEGLMTGHYTATVWSKSTEVGCGYVVCKKQCTYERPLLLVGCQYSPAGNIFGKTPFSRNVAERLHAVYPQLLPEASNDPEQVKKCEEYREELKRKNPFVNLADLGK